MLGKVEKGRKIFVEEGVPLFSTNWEEEIDSLLLGVLLDSRIA